MEEFPSELIDEICKYLDIIDIINFHMYLKRSLNWIYLQRITNFINTQKRWYDELSNDNCELNRKHFSLTQDHNILYLRYMNLNHEYTISKSNSEARHDKILSQLDKIQQNLRSTRLKFSEKK